MPLNLSENLPTRCHGTQIGPLLSGAGRFANHRQHL